MKINLKNRLPRSLFFHLVFILLVAAITIIGSVFAFLHFSNRQLNESRISQQLKSYASYIVADLGEPPQPERGREIARRLGLKIGYQAHGDSTRNEPVDERVNGTPDNPSSESVSWRSHTEMPTLAELKEYGHRHAGRPVGFGRYRGDFFYIYETPNSTFYFIPEQIEQPGRSKAIMAFLLFLSLVFFFAWLILRKLLLPLRRIEDAFGAVAAGDLESRLELNRPREFQRLGDGFNQMVERIGEMLRSRSQMLRDVSHDLRTPLTRIKLALNLLPDTPDRLSISEDVRELEQLITEILESYRTAETGSGQIPLKREELEADTLIERCITALRKLYPKREIEISQTEKKRSIHGDSAKLYRLFHNLLENALKNSPSASAVKIEITGEDGATLFRIRDEGPGIPPEYRARIFEPFFQVMPERTPEQRGYGLGLYLCKEIVAAHGGEINVEDNSPQGTLFVVRLPD